MVEKRPRAEDYDRQNGTKRPRSAASSPAPPSTNGAAPGAKTDMSKLIAEARARAEAAKARLVVGSRTASASPAPTPASPSPAPSPADAVRARLEAMKARIAAATAKTAQPVAPSRRAPSPVPALQPPAETDDGAPKGKGGLNISLHPALMGDNGPDSKAKGKAAMQPKFATTMANRRADTEQVERERRELDLAGPNLEELKKNPFYDPSIGAGTGRNRHSRQLMFNRKGKYIEQANALRLQATLEEMKKRIAAQARKAGLDEDNERAFLVPAPPDIEWWDENLVEGKSYDVLSDPNNLKIDAANSVITIYVQHPVLLQPPQEKNAPLPKPMYLTKTEQAKLRRQRRMAEHKEQQAKIRLGLEPPPPPKVKKSNLMRVLGEQAVKDPTAVEARVNREIAERRVKHEQANAERALTKEQKHEKLAKQQVHDAALGIYVSVYRIDNLSFGKHRYQIDINAKQQALTGICILHPKLNLVIVEGGEHSIKAYSKLMTRRIQWTDNAMPNNVREGNKEAEAAWLNSLDDEGKLKDLSFNKCQVVWEGQARDRTFRKWSTRVCETDADAKDILSRAKMENFWILAKSMT